MPRGRRCRVPGGGRARGRPVREAASRVRGGGGCLSTAAAVGAVIRPDAARRWLAMTGRAGAVDEEAASCVPEGRVALRWTTTARRASVMARKPTRASSRSIKGRVTMLDLSGASIVSFRHWRDAETILLLGSNDFDFSFAGREGAATADDISWQSVAPANTVNEGFDQCHLDSRADPSCWSSQSSGIALMRR